MDDVGTAFLGFELASVTMPVSDLTIAVRTIGHFVQQVSDSYTCKYNTDKPVHLTSCLQRPAGIGDHVNVSFAV